LEIDAPVLVRNSLQVLALNEARQGVGSMTLRQAYAPELPEMDPFLFASVGEEIEGIPLSVLSALSQLDVDPRPEAARLSRLARDAAADQLARMIARLPDRHWTSLEIRKIATRLVELLPPNSEDEKTVQSSGGADRTMSPRASYSLIYLALAAAVLFGIIAHSSLSSNTRATVAPASQSDSPVAPDRSR
jgi:hypothetical protein